MADADGTLGTAENAYELNDGFALSHGEIADELELAVHNGALRAECARIESVARPRERERTPT